MRSFVCEVSKDWDFLKVVHNQPKSRRISFQTHYKFSTEKSELWRFTSIYLKHGPANSAR